MLLWLYHQVALLPSWIEFNCLRNAAVGTMGLSIYWQYTAYRLVFPLQEVVLVHLHKYHHVSGNAASDKLVWKQRKCHYCWYNFLLFTRHLGLPLKTSLNSPGGACTIKSLAIRTCNKENNKKEKQSVSILIHNDTPVLQYLAFLPKNYIGKVLVIERMLNNF